MLEASLPFNSKQTFLTWDAKMRVENDVEITCEFWFWGVQRAPDFHEIYSQKGREEAW